MPHKLSETASTTRQEIQGNSSAFLAGFARAVLNAGIRSALLHLRHGCGPRYGFPAEWGDLRRELEDLVNAEPFVPFVVTSNDGFAIAVGSAKRALVGLRSSESWILRKGRGERKEGF